MVSKAVCLGYCDNTYAFNINFLMPENRKALLLGATGLIGNHLLGLLLQDDTYTTVRIIVRNPIAMQHAKLEQVKVDYNYLQYYKDSFSVDDVFCCLGTTIKKAGSQEAFYKVDATYPFEAARLAKQQGAKQYLIVTALGANKNSGVFYNRVKGEVEEKIAGLQFPSLHIFRPSLLLGERNETRTGEAIAQKIMPLFNFLMIGGLKKYKAIAGNKVARAMLKVARENIPGHHIYLSDQLQELGK
jgi:uncharacterized protein YbjT (DUF2867 family)